jgi:hypothetical protein
MIKDKASMFNGKNVPDLTDERFLMGVRAGDAASVAGGTNKIQPDGAHTHHLSGTTGPANSGLPGLGDGLTQGGNLHFHNHGFDGRTDSQDPKLHDHGGDKRPAFLTTHFIIRIK